MGEGGVACGTRAIGLWDEAALASHRRRPQAKGCKLSSFQESRQSAGWEAWEAWKRPSSHLSLSVHWAHGDACIPISI